MPKIAVIGYGTMFANIISGCIQAGYTPVGVMRYERTKTNPLWLQIKDYINPSKDKAFIEGYNLYEINAQSANSEEFKKELIKLEVDILFVASWGEKLKKEITVVPKIASINCHPSLLPRYRGPNPYIHVILNNETETGVTFHLMNEKYDSGAIISQVKVPIKSNDTGYSLRARCAKSANTEVQNLINALGEEMILPVEQNESIATYYPNLYIDDLYLDFDKTAEEIDRKIRALNSWNKCRIKYKNQILTFKRHRILNQTYPNTSSKQIIKAENNEIQITTSDNKVIALYGVSLLNESLFVTKLYIRFFVQIGDKIT